MRKNIDYDFKLIDRMLREGNSIRDIAKFYDVTESSVRSVLKTHGYVVEARLVQLG